MQEKVGEQGRLISPCLKAGALRHILVRRSVIFRACFVSFKAIDSIQIKKSRLSVGLAPKAWDFQCDNMKL